MSKLPLGILPIGSINFFLFTISSCQRTLVFCIDSFDAVFALGVKCTLTRCRMNAALGVIIKPTLTSNNHSIWTISGRSRLPTSFVGIPGLRASFQSRTALAELCDDRMLYLRRPTPATRAIPFAGVHSGVRRRVGLVLCVASNEKKLTQIVACYFDVLLP